MKNVSISLTDQHAAEIEACVSSGDYASVSEVVRAALRAFLSHGETPDHAQIDADITEYLNRRSAGELLVDADDARRHILESLKS